MRDHGEDRPATERPEQQHADALLIYQDHLDHLTSCIMRNDFACFMQRLALPHSIKNTNTEFFSETADDLQRLFDQVHHCITMDGITSFIRIAKVAEFVGPDEIIGEHESEMLRGATRAVEPYLNRLRLVRGGDGVWRETHSANAVRLKGKNIGLIAQPPGDVTLPDFADPKARES